MISHASFSHVSPVTLFVAWIVAVLRKRDFKKLQNKQGSSVRREVSCEAIHGEVAPSILRWHLAAEVRAHTEAGLGLELIFRLDVRRNCFPRRRVKQWSR